jgi:glycoprotein-N-acetylgalactosamine 3-beta-galactosyltransferase
LNTSKENNSQPQVRIYCFILTAPKFFDTRARAINSTWARRCDGYSFISEYSNDTKGLPIAPIRNLSASYEYLTQKSTSALLYIYENFLNDYDWFFKADDDTYLFVENLKQFLEDKNASEPITFGYNFKVGISNEIFNPTMDSSLCLFQQDSDYSVDVLKNLSYFYNSL